MSLNPSCNTVVGNRFPVLGDPPLSKEGCEIAMGELHKAILNSNELKFDIAKYPREVYKKGTKAYNLARSGIRFPGMASPDDIEIIDVFNVKASAYDWNFERAWYYWICDTTVRPIPLVVAKLFNEKWGQQVRADGFAGGKKILSKSDLPSGIDFYHVDTPDGLNALVELISSLRK